MIIFESEMYPRNLYKDLKAHLRSRQVTVITGMRRVGKSTAVKYLLDQVKHSNKTYLDCERIEIRSLFGQPNYETIIESLRLLPLDLSKPCVIAMDEIQLAPHLPSLIKHIYDNHPVKFIVTGSSSYYMKNQFSESLAGRKQIFEMYPLSFHEFLTFTEISGKPHDHYGWQQFNAAWYNRYKSAYEDYLQFGGFPEVALQKKKKDSNDNGKHQPNPKTVSYTSN